MPTTTLPAWAENPAARHAIEKLAGANLVIREREAVLGAALRYVPVGNFWPGQLGPDKLLGVLRGMAELYAEATLHDGTDAFAEHCDYARGYASAADALIARVRGEHVECRRVAA